MAWKPSNSSSSLPTGKGEEAKIFISYGNKNQTTAIVVF
jgi:hypothetical protein